MKMLVSRTSEIGAPPFQLEDLQRHLRVRAGRDDSAIFDMGMTAAADIEHVAQVALFIQTIKVTIFSPPQDAGLNLPIGPVADEDLPTVFIDGAAFTAFDFAGGQRPYIRWQDDFFNLSPGQLTISYQAGFGSECTDIPFDLRQAIMDQTAVYYDARGPVDTRMATTSPHMSRIAARYRGVQA